MIFKVVFNKKIHLINSENKNSIKQLHQIIESIYKDLPKKYSLSYIDEDQDQITLHDENDFKILLGSSLKNVKIFVKQVNEEFIQQTQKLNIDEEFFQEIKQIEPQKKEKILQVKPEMEIQIDEKMIQEKLSKMLPEIVSKIKSEINQQLSQRSKISNQPQIIEQPIKKQKITQQKKVEPQPESEYIDGKYIHKYVKCDNCQGPVIGYRYKCAVCPNFDFCQNCESSNEHIHPFLKIKNRQQTPIKIFAVLNDDSQNSFEINGQRYNLGNQINSLFHKGAQFFKNMATGQNGQILKQNFKNWKNQWKNHHGQNAGYGPCHRGRGWMFCPKTEEMKEQKPKYEQKKTEKMQQEKFIDEKLILENAKYLTQIFDNDHQYNMEYSRLYYTVTKEQLLEIALGDSNYKQSRFD